MKVILKNVRLAFPAIFEAKTVNGEGEPAYSGAFLMSPDHPSIAELNAAIEQVAKDKWGAKAPDVLKQMRMKDFVCLHDGDLKSDYDGFPGNFYVSARSKVRPVTTDRQNNPTVAADGLIYGGSFVHASIELWAQDNNYGKRINAQLKGVMAYKDGDAFSGGTPGTADDFADLAEGADEAALA